MISVVINTLNESANIAGCIESVRNFADEIVVCDMHSEDDTVEIAHRLGARVEMVTAEYCDFGRLRHFAVQQARYPWVLVLDADERLTAPLAQKLRTIAEQDRYNVVQLANLYYFFGGWVRHGRFFNNNWPRFFRKSTYLSRYREEDELVHNDLSALNGETNVLVLPKTYYLEHYAYPTIEKYVKKTIGMYGRLTAEQLHKSGETFSLFKLVTHPVKHFLMRYFLYQGYKDGVRGFILIVLISLYKFTIWANVWLLEQQAKSQHQSTGNEQFEKMV